MSKENLELANAVMEKLDTTGSAVISDYSHWFIISSSVWCVIAIAAIAWSFKTKMVDDEHSDIPWVKLGRVFAIIAGAIMMGCNIPDLLSPTAIATHQLLNDIF